MAEKATKKIEKIKKNEKVVSMNRTVKAKKIDEVKKEKIVFASGKYLRHSPQKARLVCDLIRGKKVVDSLYILENLNKKVCHEIENVLKSAVANAVNNFDLDEKKLFVKYLNVLEAPTLKRGRAGSRGRYSKILKRCCHVKVGVCEVS